MAKTTQTQQKQKKSMPVPPPATPEALAALPAGIPKNFRQQADMEAFYRFVYENDLRDEALTIFDETRAAKNALRKAKSKVKH